MHFTETPEAVCTGHFAGEVDDWDQMLFNLDKLGAAYYTAIRQRQNYLKGEK